MDNATIQKVLFEIEQIDEHIKVSSRLVNLCKTKNPDFGEKSGVAMILHSFYNGIENIMLQIIKNKDMNLPKGMRWHKELLDRAFEKTENRSAIFRAELKEPLDGYLKFRHLVRHIYGFQLLWEDMKDIAFNMDTVWKDVKEDINAFVVANRVNA